MQLKTFDPMQSIKIYNDAQDRVYNKKLSDYKMQRQTLQDSRLDSAYQRAEADRPRLEAIAKRKSNVMEDEDMRKLGMQQILSLNPDSDTFQQDAYSSISKYLNEMHRRGYDPQQVEQTGRKIIGIADNPDAVRQYQIKMGLRAKPKKKVALTPYQLEMLRLKNKEASNKELEKENKPLPTSALKMKLDTEKLIGTVDTINGDIDRLVGKIDDGSIDLGMFSNIANRTLNFVGMSDKESKGLADLETSLKKMRDDSLRLNTGVQTDGDAKRAWESLFGNLNDGKVVKMQLEKIMELNNQARLLRQKEIDEINKNYGKPLQYDGAPRANSTTFGGNTGDVTFGELK